MRGSSTSCAAPSTCGIAEYLLIRGAETTNPNVGCDALDSSRQQYGREEMADDSGADDDDEGDDGP